MGLTTQSTGLNALEKKSNSNDYCNNKVIALAGNPNVGKSTVFNGITGLRQHTGNWPGKTVCTATGTYFYNQTNFTIVDIPGTYSLMANSEEEKVARDFICFGKPDAIIIVVDSTCLERNLNLVLQIIEIKKEVIVCVNLMDEAKRKGIVIDFHKLSQILGVPVIPTSANSKYGLNKLMDTVSEITLNKTNLCPCTVTYSTPIENAISSMTGILSSILKNRINIRWTALKLLENDSSILSSLENYLGFDICKNKELSIILDKAQKSLKNNNINTENFKDIIVSSIVHKAEEISHATLAYRIEQYNKRDRKIDSILTSKKFGIPIMLFLLCIIFWITITGANYPSQIISTFLFFIQENLTKLFNSLVVPSWIEGILIQGMYRTLAWVVSVMLPPMAIFFPIFTILEDLGYLPRIAFNLDNFFKKSCACGKQALTMCMGFGCNASGIVGCRIIDSPRERLIAIITNNFVPCNGRFPTLITIITIFFTGILPNPYNSIISSLILTCIIVLGVFMTLIISKLLSKTILKGIPSSFTLELPPYRKPMIGQLIVRSIFDRTLFVLGRAIVVAAPAGIIIWSLANIHVNNISLLTYCADFLNPFAQLIGLDGYILMAFILGFPANEIIIPIIIMSYMSKGSLLEINDMFVLRNLLMENGWTWLTAINVMLFSLMHWPCSTTCLTIKKETQSIKWTAISFLIPTITGISICFIVTTAARLLGIA